MWKDWQELIGPKTYEKKCQTEQTCEDRNKTNKNLGFLGNSIMHTRTSLRMHNQACMHRLDHMYADPCPENLKNSEIEQNFKITILTT